MSFSKHLSDERGVAHILALLLMVGVVGVGSFFLIQSKSRLNLSNVLGYTAPQEVKVLQLKYFPVDSSGVNIDRSIVGPSYPASTLSQIRTLSSQWDKEAVERFTDSTRFRGYKNPNAQPALQYKIIENKEYLTPAPLSTNKVPWNAHIPTYRFDMKKILNDVNICDYVDNKGVTQVWMQAYHYGPAEPYESNMSMGTKSKAFWNYSTYGNISNSERINDMPVCQNTYLLLAAGDPHSLGHQIETVLDWANNVLWYDFTRPHGQNNPTVNHCGTVHHPPNTTKAYQYNSSQNLTSDCEDWKPGGGGATKQINCNTWYGATCSGHEGNDREYLKWWMQNIPGLNNGLTYQGAKLRNWWDFIGNFDEAVATGGRSLTQSQTPTQTPTPTPTQTPTPTPSPTPSGPVLSVDKTSVEVTLKKSAASSGIIYGIGFTITNNSAKVASWGVNSSTHAQNYGFIEASGGIAPNGKSNIRTYIYSSKPAGTYIGTANITTPDSSGVWKTFTTVSYKINLVDDVSPTPTPSPTPKPVPTPTPIATTQPVTGSPNFDLNSTKVICKSGVPSVELKWQLVSGKTEYKLYKRNVTTGVVEMPFSRNSNIYIDTKVSNGMSYGYNVEAWAAKDDYGKAKIGNLVTIPVFCPLPPTQDSDKDGFTDNQEIFMGTNTQKACGVDGWPVDVNNDTFVSGADISSLLPYLTGLKSYNKRYDLNQDGTISQAGEIPVIQKYFGKGCSSTVKIYAAGKPLNNIYPTVKVTVTQGKDVYEKTFTDVRGRDWPIKMMQELVFTVPVKVTPDQVRISYTNDETNSKTREDRLVVIDKINIDGTDYQTEDSTVYSVGGLGRGGKCDSGYLKTEALLCNGYFEFFSKQKEPRGIFNVR